MCFVQFLMFLVMVVKTGDEEMTLLEMFELSSLVKEVVKQLCDDMNTTTVLAALQQHLKFMNELLHTKKVT